MNISMRNCLSKNKGNRILKTSEYTKVNAIFVLIKVQFSKYEGHPINRENSLIMQEFVPLEHGKCNH